MNKIVKTLLITSGICGGTGVLLLTVGVLMGARGSRFWEALSIQIKDGWERGVFEEVEKSEATETDGDSGQWNTTVHTDVQKLDIDLGARKIYLEEYDGENLQVLVENGDKKVTVKQKGKELQIGMGTSIMQNEQKERIVKVLIPQEYEFEEVDVSIGAGECVMENLNAKTIDMETGAGSILGEGRIQAEESSWDVSAGSIVLQELQSEDTEIDCAAGSFEATFAGAKEEYYLEGDVGAGSFEVGGSSWDTLGKNISLGDQHAKKKIFSDCAAGSVTIDFVKS